MALCDPRLRHCQEIVDCSFTKVVACRVGASFSHAVKTREFACAKRKTLPCDAAASVGGIEGFLRGGEVSLREFTLEELMEATNGFRQETLLGCRGFGKIYRGRLPDGNSIAIKVLNGNTHYSGFLEQFETELRVGRLIAHGSYPNLLQVMGYHYAHLEEAIIMILVYPFLANRDLGQYFCDHGPSQIPPDWPTRKKIALGVARGIYSLHQLGVVHLDIKPSNVLLDENFNARVGDFGLAKFMALSDNRYDVAGLHDDVDSHYCSRICGTMGYISPELLTNGQCSRKSDVYAYGVTLIQIVTGMPYVFSLEDGSQHQGILYWAEKLFKKKEELTRLMHPNMLGIYDESEALELIQLGLVCAQHDPAKRPLMPEVIAIMEGSSAALQQRWNNYDYAIVNGLSWACYGRATDFSLISSHISIPWTIFTSVRGRGSRSMNDEDRVGSTLEFDMNEEGPEEKRHNRNELQRENDDFSSSEDSNKEYQVSSTNFALIEFVGVDPNETGSSKLSSLKDNRQHKEQYSDKDDTKLKDVLDQMHELELIHEAAMEEMYKKQTEIMQVMVKMQGQYIQKVNEMQHQVDRLKRGGFTREKKKSILMYDGK